LLYAAPENADHQKVVAGKKRQLFCASDVHLQYWYFLYWEIEKWRTNFHPAPQWTGPGPYIWLLMLMLMQVTIDAMHWSATYIANGKRAKAILTN
jgi:hypothetical protein